MSSERTNKAVTKPSVIIGLGNPVLADDTIGLLIVKEMKVRLASRFPQVDFRLNYSGGFDLLYDLIDFNHAIIVDSINTNKAFPGYCHEFSLEDFKTIPQPCVVDSHGMNLITILETGKKCGYTMPTDIAVFGIEGMEFYRLSEFPSTQVYQNRKNIIEKITKKLYYWYDN